MARGKARGRTSRDPHVESKTSTHEEHSGIDYGCEKSIDDLLRRDDNKYADERVDMYARLAWLHARLLQPALLDQLAGGDGFTKLERSARFLNNQPV